MKVRVSVRVRVRVEIRDEICLLATDDFRTGQDG